MSKPLTALIASTEAALERHKQGLLGPTGVSALLMDTLHQLRGLDAARPSGEVERPRPARRSDPMTCKHSNWYRDTRNYSWCQDCGRFAEDVMERRLDTTRLADAFLIAGNLDGVYDDLQLAAAVAAEYARLAALDGRREEG